MENGLLFVLWACMYVYMYVRTYVACVCVCVCVCVQVLALSVREAMQQTLETLYSKQLTSSGMEVGASGEHPTDGR